MSFDNFYKNRKDWRKPYKGSQSFDPHCRNHNRCSWCEQNRLHADRLQRLRADEQLDELNVERLYYDSIETGVSKTTDIIGEDHDGTLKP